MALFDTSEILQLNDKIHTIVLKDPTRIDDDDIDLFVVKPPPDADELDRNGFRAPVESMASNLCKACHRALEYFSFWLVGKVEANREPEAKEGFDQLPPACLVHVGLRPLEEGESASCHLCVLLMAKIRVRRIAMRSIAQSNIEMCWQSREEKPPRLHFAVVHQGHPRATNNYMNILRLRLWPASEFDVSALGFTEASPTLERHSNTGSPQSRASALQWLERCQANQDGKHHQCNRPADEWLPTRLLDVASSMTTGKLKLVTPADTPEAFMSDKRYVTLSHCWGRASLPSLTMENLSVRARDGILVAHLPQTFREAVQVAHWFGVRWLWIDSMCIIQDSEEDWQHEAVMMYGVYKNALLNISADDSPDARWGLFRERVPSNVMPMYLQFPDPVSEDPRFFLTESSFGVFESVNDTPLAKRGWVFQERQLSRRVLHFTSSELIWECCATAPYAASETFPGGTPFETVFSGKSKFQAQTDLNNPASMPKLYETWDNLCKEYSAKAFTHVRDKLVALSGLAQQFQGAFPADTYLAGMWRSRMPQNLLWQSAETSSPIQASDYIAPSWSWVSINGPISLLGQLDDRPAHSLVELLNTDTNPVIPSTPTGMLKSASLRLRCFLRPVEVRPDYEKKAWYMMAMRSGGKAHCLYVKDEDGRELTSFDDFHGNSFYYSFDVESDGDSGPESVAGYLLPLCMSQPDEVSALTLRGLLVQRVGDCGDVYRRVGLLHVYSERCLKIKYTLKGPDDWATWDDLGELLKETHESGERLRRDGWFDGTRGKQPVSGGSSRPSSLSSGYLGEDHGGGGGETGDDIEVKGKGKEVARPVQSEEVSERAESHGKTLDEKLEAPEIGGGGNDEDGRTGESKTVVDVGSVDPLERLYCLDGALHGSEIEGKLERMVPRDIILI
ncbi:hypothetical protein OQA88_7215 [Cercophora sp. LCS_1]